MKAKTGKDWPAWFEILDAAGAQKMSHKEIVAFLVENYQVGAWWQQMVTVTYEQARGLRDKHEKADGFQISRSKFITASIEKVFLAWQEASQRSRCLPDPAFTIRRQTQNKSLRAVWVDGQTNLDVDFYVKGPARTQVTVQHSRLEDAQQAEAMKIYWAAALNRLDEFLKG
ncbi:MAG: DUF4287 domain-containing protein [Chloroflexi bacterium]|nr:DUF4287 domain-containing protein [Chloroflexota bacterium]